MPAEFNRYRFIDFLIAALIAPLAAIPATAVAFFLVILSSGRMEYIIQNAYQGDLVKFTASLFSLNLYAVPSAYLSTFIFGGLGLAWANRARYHVSFTAGAVSGMVCGTAVGLEWTLFLTGGRFDSGFINFMISSPVFPIAILSGLAVGLLFIFLLNKPFQTENNPPPPSS